MIFYTPYWKIKLYNSPPMGSIRLPHPKLLEFGWRNYLISYTNQVLYYQQP
jgi:hypothetical protein